MIQEYKPQTDMLYKIQPNITVKSEFEVKLERDLLQVPFLI